MAEVIARGLVENGETAEAEVRSAGTSTMDGRPASAGALRAARRRGLDLGDHASTSLSEELIRWADLVLTMGPSHLARVHALGGEGKSALLGAYALARDDALEPAVPDPFGGDHQVYEDTFVTLEGMVRAAMGRFPKEEEA